MDGEDLDSSEVLRIAVSFLSYKSTDVLEELKEIIPKNMVDDDSRTLLHWAAHQGQLNKVKFLIESDLTDPVLQDSKGYTALDLACKQKHSGVISYLRGLGFEPKIDPRKSLNPEVDRDKEGMIAACLLADNINGLQSHLEYIKNLNGFFSIHDFYEMTLLGVAGFQLAPKCLELFFNCGCSADVCDEDGLSCVDNLLNSLILVIPPEDETEFVEYRAGIECLEVVIRKVRNLKRHRTRLGIVFERSARVGVGSSKSSDSFEEGVVMTNLGFRLMLERYLENMD